MSRHRTVLATGLAAFLAVVSSPPLGAADPSSPEELAAAVARPAIVFVQTAWHGWVRDRKTGEVFGGTAGYDVTVSCTGAVINPDGYVATASHCVHTGPLGGSGALFDAAIAELAKAGRIGDAAKARRDFAERAVAEGAVPDSPLDREIRVERMAGGEERTRDVATASVVDLAAPDDGDVAVLKIARDRLPAMELRPDEAPVGMPVLAIGYPGSVDVATDPDLEPSSKNGQISAHRTLQDHPFYEFSAAATHGMSGGPVVDMRGRIVGLISRGSPEETQSFNFATAASNLADLLRDKGIGAELGVHDRNYRGGLDRFFAGDFNGAVEFFDAVLAGAPTNEQAAEFRKLAVDKGGRAGSGPTLLVGVAIGCAGLAVLAAALGILVLILGRRRTPSTMDTPPYGVVVPPAAG
jgi:serine protease Do